MEDGAVLADRRLVPVADLARGVAALANANATGVRLRAPPFTADRVWQELRAHGRAHAAAGTASP